MGRLDLSNGQVAARAPARQVKPKRPSITRSGNRQFAGAIANTVPPIDCIRILRLEHLLDSAVRPCAGALQALSEPVWLAQATSSGGPRIERVFAAAAGC